MNYKLINFRNKAPQIHKSVFLADNVIIAADVTIKENANIWFNTVIRGDVAPIIIGKNTNIQDGSVIHTSRLNAGKTTIGDNVTVGHMALLHACTIENNAFIGMNSTLMDKSIVEEYGFIAAGSLVSPGKIIRKKELWMGSPARFVRMITDEEIKFMKNNIKNYLELSKYYKN